MALGKNPRSLTLGGLADVSPEVQDKLAETVGALTVPNLASLDSLPLTKKLAAGFAQSVLLPAIKTLSVEQATEIASVKRQFLFGRHISSADRDDGGSRDGVCEQPRCWASGAGGRSDLRCHPSRFWCSPN